jgi:hypothetical protein
MTVTFADEPVTASKNQDATPDFSDEPEYPCVVCGAEAGPYGGRGRKPTRCAIHKKSSAGSGGQRAPRVTGKASELAAQATEALCSIDGMMALGARIVGFTRTAETIEDADETFRIRVNAALLNSPDTCRKILRYGSKGGDAALFIAIGLHIATIAPVFAAEAREKKAEKEAARAAAELESQG